MRVDRFEVAGRQGGRPVVEGATRGRQPDAIEDGLAYGQSPVLSVCELREVADRAEAPDDAVVRGFAVGEDAQQR